jgi:hypothetical protein
MKTQRKQPQPIISIKGVVFVSKLFLKKAYFTDV